MARWRRAILPWRRPGAPTTRWYASTSQPFYVELGDKYEPTLAGHSLDPMLSVDGHVTEPDDAPRLNASNAGDRLNRSVT